MMGEILRATNKNLTMRIFAINSTDMVEKARSIHHTTPVASAALGRMISAASMMGVMMKGDDDKLTVQIKGDGPLGGVVAVVNSKGDVKAYPLDPMVDLPLRSDGKLDVSGALGKSGKLTVIKDLGLKEPYIGQTDLVTGEIAEDITAYYAYSEQQPSAVALGVLVAPDQSIQAAGGFIVQLMPDALDSEIDQLEKNLRKLSSVSHLIDEGKSLKQIVELVMEGLEPIFNDKVQVGFRCDCSRERMEAALVSIGLEELEDILANEKETELQCHFCNTKYKFSEQDIRDLIQGAQG
ncbi:MAG: Hsp33 family molecular chaperone HslO [Peptostreptococcaceae bacterium]|nr:Hsp33 family molecular chaperone HslO [Peptostreptococcaceae bacterium]